MLVVELAVVFLGQSVRVAEDVAAFALYSQQSYLFVTIETSLLVLLLFLGRL